MMGRFVGTGEAMPPGYGVGYLRFDVNGVMCYPVPFNIVVALAHRAMGWLRSPMSWHRREAGLIHQARAEGYREGEKVGFAKGRTAGFKEGYDSVLKTLGEKFGAQRGIDDETPRPRTP